MGEDVSLLVVPAFMRFVPAIRDVRCEPKSLALGWRRRLTKFMITDLKTRSKTR